MRCSCTDAFKISSLVRHRLECHAPRPLIFLRPGRDFNPEEVLTVSAQVEKLILQATSLENLCQCFSGWYVCSPCRLPASPC